MANYKNNYSLRRVIVSVVIIPLPNSPPLYKNEVKLGHKVYPSSVKLLTHHTLTANTGKKTKH